MAPADGPFGGSIDVPFSNAALLIVSVCGFSMLAVTLYKVIIVRLKTSEELENEIADDADYEERLKRTDVSTLTRAERRARAHAIMKEKRRIQQQSLDGETENQHNDTSGSTGKPSRRERERAAKAQEKAERKLYEKERLEQQLLAQSIARREKEHRDAEMEKRRREEANRAKLKTEARELAAMQEWNTFISTRAGSLSVSGWIEQASRERYIPVDDIAKSFETSTQTVLDRINALLHEGRLYGLIDNEHFLFLDHQEMDAIAAAVKERGSASLSDISVIVEEVISRAA